MEKKEFEVIVKETSLRKVSVRAFDEEDATKIVEGMYKSEEIMLDSSDFAGVRIFVENTKVKENERNIILYQFNVKGVKTESEIRDLLEEINNCEFCNKYLYTLKLIDFSYDQYEDMGNAIILIKTEPESENEIHENMTEMLYCEFCHKNIHLAISKLN